MVNVTENNALQEIVVAAEVLVARLDEMIKPIDAILSFASTHSIHYSGPTWEAPLARLREDLATLKTIREIEAD